MKKIIYILVCLVVASCATTNRTSTLENIKFEGEQLVVVSIPIGGQQKNFIVDTGSSCSYIATNFLKEERHYNINENEIHYAGINENVTHKSASVKVVIFENSYWFKTIDLYNINKVMKLPIVGILGCDFLRKNKLIIDYNKRIIYQSKD